MIVSGSIWSCAHGATASTLSTGNVLHEGPAILLLTLSGLHCRLTDGNSNMVQGLAAVAHLGEMGLGCRVGLGCTSLFPVNVDLHIKRFSSSSSEHLFTLLRFRYDNNAHHVTLNLTLHRALPSPDNPLPTTRSSRYV